MWSSTRFRQLSSKNNNNDSYDALQESIYENLMALRFDRFCKNAHNKFPLKELDRNMFAKANQKAFEAVMYFLIKNLSNDHTINQFRSCYPCYDRDQQSEFRKLTSNYLKELEKASATLKFTPIFAHNPGGEAFSIYLLNLTNYALKKYLKNHFNITMEVTGEYAAKQEEADESTKLDENLQTLKSLEEKELVLKYLESREEKLQKEYGEVDSKLNVALSRCSDIVQSDITNCEKSLWALTHKQRSSLTSKHTEIDLMATKISQSIQDLWSSLDDFSRGQETKHLNLSPIIMNSKLALLTKNNLLDVHKLRASLNRFSHCYVNTLTSWSKPDERDRLVSNLTTVKEEITRTINSIEKDIEMLEPGKEILSTKVQAKRKSLLDLAIVQERRKWFAKRLGAMIAPLSSLRITFDSKKVIPKNNDSSSNDSLSFSSPFNYGKQRASFHPADISTMSYIPPSAPDNPILSPLREEWS